MGSIRRGSNGESLGRVASGRLVFDSGLVSLDDPRITPLREGYDELVGRLLRSSNQVASGPGRGRGPK
jgi:hypothetical protein